MEAGARLPSPSPLSLSLQKSLFPHLKHSLTTEAALPKWPTLSCGFIRFMILVY